MPIASIRSPRSWSKRLPLRLSMRTLLILFLVLGCWLGWFVRVTQIQREVVAAVDRYGTPLIYPSMARGASRCGIA
jgi:hypothetical protein